MTALLPGAIAAEPFLSLDALWEQRLANIDLSALLVKLSQYADPDALPHLGWEFGAIDEVWNASSDEEKQALLARVLARRRFRGTRWAVRDALEAIGVAPIAMQFRPDLLADGSIYADGTFVAGGKNRFVYWVVLIGAVIEGPARSRVIASYNAWRQKTVHLGELMHAASEADFTDVPQFENIHTVLSASALVAYSKTSIAVVFTRKLRASDPLPAASDFVVTVLGTGGGPIAVTDVSRLNDTITLTLASPANPLAALSVAYTPGTNPVRSRIGSPFPALTIMAEFYLPNHLLVDEFGFFGLSETDEIGVSS